MQRFFTAFTATAALVFSPSISTAVAEGFDAQAYDQFISGRVGNGDPVYWYSVGTIKAYPSGEILFRMEGFDAARSHVPEADKRYTQQYNRKIYFYRDPASGDILTEWNGKQVDPIAYPYQFITYELQGDTIETFVEQGEEPRIQKFGPSNDMSARKLGDTLVVTAPVYLDIEIPNSERRIDAFENYDFFFHPEDTVGEPNQLSWVRYGDLPPWAGKGKAIYHMVTWRLDGWEEMPTDLRKYVEENHSLWMNPPESLEEVRALQQGTNTDGAKKGF